MVLILSSYYQYFAYICDRTSWLLHLPQVDQRRSYQGIIMYYVKQVARPPAWALP
ncbi:hypothetical protein H6G97_09420 [Nostoc flagelliforme FACHB-838]|uniref:Uncharacterized protein n=1 Tax=Nostoc flagelliforme FACHB-838 TaxID=2692904 RepID=A0ABR8DL81_9NOSO|nr:hypothetical protein [Nostoc flagelliforme]MBD2529773.1 hypothetical protein [Nostoc flagelliforme FACHB-838]